MTKKNKIKKINLEGFDYLISNNEKVVGIITETKTKICFIFKPNSLFQLKESLPQTFNHVKKGRASDSSLPSNSNVFSKKNVSKSAFRKKSTGRGNSPPSSSSLCKFGKASTRGKQKPRVYIQNGKKEKIKK